MNRLLLLGMALGLGAAAFTNSPADAATSVDTASDAVELDDGKCKTEGRWIKGLKEACAEGGEKKAKKMMKKMVKKCKKQIKKADGAKAAAKMNCDACHVDGDHTKLKGDEAKISEIKAKCSDVDW